MRKAYGSEPSVDLLRSFLNLVHAGDWLTLSSRGGADVPKALTKPLLIEMDFRSFMVQGVDGEFNFLPKGEVGKRSKVAQKRKVIVGSHREDPHQKTQKVPAQASKVAGDTSTPLDVDSDPDIHVSIVGSYFKRRSGSTMSRLFLPFMLKSEASNLKGRDSRLLKSSFYNRLVKASIIYGRCATFEEIAELKRPFVLEEKPGYRPSSNKEYDRAGNDLADASYPFLAELTVDPYASVEQLLSKKPQSLRSKLLFLKAS
uniref:Uncharacterized protein n=1 Tax=Tanacetum cinerariifolium TaxID=118510 RepID=A0A6L2JF49_TANCI|nr:hypothetical protein [Tanacetum cinerariifolium]